MTDDGSASTGARRVVAICTLKTEAGAAVPSVVNPRIFSLTLLACAWSSTAWAEELQVHATGGAAHAVGGEQQREFGVGATGGGSVELPLKKQLGVQASAGALVLSKGSDPNDATLAPSSTGSAFFGTLGVRVHPFAHKRVAGLWADTNGGLARTGDATRPMFDAHVGWDFRVSRDERIDVGPFLGYTQIIQPSSDLRSDDARILTAGISVSLGARETARSTPTFEPPPPPPAPAPERDGFASAFDACPGEESPVDRANGCAPAEGQIHLVADQIVLDDVIHFKFDSADIDVKSHRMMRNLARFIKEHGDIQSISIEGHSDEVGSEDYNVRLSEARAASTRDLLVSFGVEGDRLSVVGHGKSKPKVVRRGPDAANRRVEFVVTRMREEPSAHAAPASGPKGEE